MRYKMIILLIFAFILLDNRMGAIAFPVSSGVFIDANGEETKILHQIKGARADINISDEVQEVTFFIAQFSQKGLLKKVVYRRYTDLSQKPLKAEVFLQNAIASDDIIKTYAWDGLGSVTPLSSSVTIGNKGPEIGKILPSFEKAKTDLAGKFSEDCLAMLLDYPIAKSGNDFIAMEEDNDIRPFNVDGTALVPASFIATHFGANVVWDKTASKLTITQDQKIIELVVGQKKIVIDGAPSDLELAITSYHDVVFAPVRPLCEAMGINLFVDDRGLIVLSYAPVFSKASGDDQVLIQYLIGAIKEETTAFAGGKYSTVYMSSRWYRTDGRDGQWGTLDAIKRFMATGDKWSYITNKSEIQSMTDLGISFQGAINANMGITGVTEAKYFDGAIAQAPWMSWVHIWSCANSPEYKQLLKNNIKTMIDSGVREIQYDDWSLNMSAINWGACYCDHCMSLFTQYLKNNYTAADYATFGITNINTFNLKTFLAGKGVVTNAQAMTKMASLAMNTPFNKFQAESVRAHHAELKAYMDGYAKRPILFTHNTRALSKTYPIPESQSLAYDIFDGAMGETHMDGMMADAIVEEGYISRAVGKQFIISPLPENEATMETLRSGIAMAYATGQFLLIPWDAWLEGSTRYFAKTEELEGLYWFVRQYPELFDHYEAIEKVGVTVNLNVEPAGSLKSNLFSLYQKGIPVKALVTMKNNPNFYIQQEQLEGLSDIIQLSDISQIAEPEKALIENCGAMVTDLTDAQGISDIANATFLAKVQGDLKDTFAVLRENTLYTDAPKMLHVVSYAGLKQSSVTVEVNNRYLYGDSADLVCTIYEPGKNPVVKNIKSGSGKTLITLDVLDRWAVVSIGTSTSQKNSGYQLSDGLSGIGLGTRQSNDTASGGNGRVEMVTYGAGTGVRTAADTTGSQEEGNFVYQNLHAGSLKEYSVCAKFSEIGGTGGLMVRENPTANARFLALIWDGAELKIASRNEINKSVTYTKVGNVKPTYAKLVKVGSTICAYTSNDGVGYALAGQVSISINSPLAGVFAASNTLFAAKSTFEDLQFDEGAYPNDPIKTFTIGIADNEIHMKEKQKLNLYIETTSGKQLTTNDVDLSYTSGNEQVLKVNVDGTLLPVAIGTASVKATFTMGSVKSEAAATITVVKADLLMYRPDFSGGFKKEMKSNNDANKIENNQLIVSSTESGMTSDVNFTFEQRREDTVYEFDFSAVFGTESQTTGTRVLYTDGMAVSVTADKNGFNYFFGDDQIKIAAIEEGRTYHVKVVIYYSTAACDVYIDGEQVVDKGIFRSSAAPSGTFQLGGWRVGTDTRYIWSNLTVSSVE